MKKIIFVTIILMLISAPSFGYEWSIEPGAIMGVYQPLSENWDELLGGKPMSMFGISVNSELLAGFGPYLSVTHSNVDTTYLDEIDIGFYATSVFLGAHYRYYILDWLAPGVEAGGMFAGYLEKISDDVFEYEQTHYGLGFELSTDWTFFPFRWTESWAGGLAFSLRGVYQYRPLDEMGDLTDASGFGFLFLTSYKFDIGKQKTVKERKALSPDEPWEPEDRPGEKDKEPDEPESLSGDPG